MKKLPLGRQTFRDIVEEELLYVDKTQDIYNLLMTKGKFFFLSRPRRFGKSLLISTLDDIFSGNKELFKGLWIYDKIDWKKYPVIRIDFTAMLYTDGLDAFKSSFFNKIVYIGKTHGLDILSTNYKESINELIIKLSEKEKVVILIDEYDKPITNFIEDIELVRQYKDVLKNFYETIKESDQYIKFAFLTGVSKFSKISVFSGLNNLRDITLEEKFSTMLGYTENELFSYFDEHIKATANKLNVTDDYLKETLKNWYNGYSWDGVNFVYNPFSILNVLTVQEIHNYWFQSGTPTFLIKLIRDKDVDVKKLENLDLDAEVLDSFEIENIDVESLLFQTGYLTIKKVIRHSISDKSYILSYPNMEVKESLLKHILSNFLSYQRSDVLSSKLYRALNKNNLDEFFKVLFDIFTHIPAVIFMKDKEAYYHTIIYIILTLIGVRINVEIFTNKGRIDAVIETEDNIYILEFKMSSTSQAIKQIETKKYYESYLLSKKKIYLIGVSFDSKERNIKDWQIKELQ